MRLALKVVMQNDGDFLDVILLYYPSPLSGPHSQSNALFASEVCHDCSAPNTHVQRIATGLHGPLGFV